MPIVKQYSHLLEDAPHRFGYFSTCKTCKSLEHSAYFYIPNVPNVLEQLNFHERYYLTPLKIYCSAFYPQSAMSSYLHYKGTGSLSTNINAWKLYAGTPAAMVIDELDSVPSDVNTEHIEAALEWLFSHNPYFREMPKSLLNKLHTDTDAFPFTRLQSTHDNPLVNGAVMPISDFAPMTANEDFWTDHLPAGLSKWTQDVFTWSNTDTEAKLFPHIYPDGRGLPSPHAKGAAKQLRHRLLHIDPRWRRDPVYLFYRYTERDLRCIFYERTRLAKNARATNMTAHGLLQPTNYPQQGTSTHHHRYHLNEDLTWPVSAKVRGGPAHWKQERLDVLAYTTVIGNPHIFMTATTCEHHYPEIQRLRTHADDTYYTEPVLTASILRKRFLMLWRTLIVGKTTSIFAKLGLYVSDFYVRTEFQKRGSPHWHMLLWLSRRDSTSTPIDPQELLPLICAHLPNAEDELSAKLRDVVGTCQTHTCRQDRCNPTGTSCKYGFPHPINLNSYITPDGTAHPFRPDQHSRNINNYNPDILAAWQANMDIQLVTSRNVATYVTKYVTKEEPAGFTEVPSASNDAGSASHYLRTRNISTFEMAYSLLGYPMSAGSRSVTYVPIDLPAQHVRAVKRAHDLAHLPADSNDVFLDGWTEKYCERPPQLEAVTYLDYARNYNVGGKARNTDAMDDNDDNDDSGSDSDLATPHRSHPLTDAKLRKITVRTHPRIVRHAHIQPQDGDAYFLVQLVQVFPYRNVDNLRRGYPTFRAAYHAYILQRDMDRYFPSAHDHLLGEQEMNASAQQAAAFLEDLGETLDAATSEMLQRELALTAASFARPTDAARALAATTAALSDDQYQTLTGCLDSDAPQLSFITGGAGTGKTHLMRTLIACAKATQGISCAVLAPTGLAAHLIDGSTIHSYFRIRENEPLEFETLVHNDVQWRNQVQKLTHMFIDEISMLSADLLDFLDKLLRRVRNIDTPFGGIRAIFCGDLFQLRPVHGQMVFRHPMWRLFQVYYLSTNHRQGPDTRFTDLLNRVRRAEHTADDIELLRQRIIHTDKDSIRLLTSATSLTPKRRMTGTYLHCNRRC